MKFKLDKLLDYLLSTYSVSSFALDVWLTCEGQAKLKRFTEPNPLVNSFVHSYGTPNGLLLFGVLEYGTIAALGLAYYKLFDYLLKHERYERVRPLRKLCFYLLLAIHGSSHLKGALSWL